MTTRKHSQAFFEIRANLYVPETSEDYEPLMQELRNTLAYQQGLRDGLSGRRAAQAKQRLRDVEPDPFEGGSNGLAK